ELINEPATMVCDTFLGGSQAICLDGGWLCVIHESEWVNGMRRYFHRFVWLDSRNHLKLLSRRFYLRLPGYELVAGLAWHPDGQRLVLSFSQNDCDLFLAVFDADEIRGILLDASDHERASNDAIAQSLNTLRDLARTVSREYQEAR